MGNRRSSMGAGATTAAQQQQGGGGQQAGQVFGGEQQNGGGVRNGSELTAEQLQLLIQAGRLQYGGGGDLAAGGDNGTMTAPQPQFRSAKVTKNPFNLKKNTVRLKKDEETGSFYVEFDFDAAEPCIVSIHYFSREYVTPEHLTVKFVTEPGLNQALSVTPVTYPAGMNQKFTKEHAIETPFNFDAVPPAILHYSERSTCYPLMIDLRAADTDQSHQLRTAQTTFLTLDTNRHTVKPVKQKVSVGGQAYELHDIYGISSNTGDERTGDDAADEIVEDDGDSLCVICLSDPRDTAVLPCRHMCLCSECAQSLRTQSNKCPICRGPVQSLLHIKVET